MTFSALRQLSHMLVWLCMCVALGSCIVPILPQRKPVATKRENLEEHLLNFITVGVTTKEDVLMHLGEANNLWPESQLHYYYIIRGGGFGLVFPPAVAGFYRELWRTLIIEFDKEGIVTSAHLRTERCSVVIGAREQSPCNLIKKVTISNDSSLGTDYENSP